MDSLQRQMEEHTITVHESMSSWTQIEGQLMDLTSICPTAASSEQDIPVVDKQERNHNAGDKEAMKQWRPHWLFCFTTALSV